jgi:hypothetical protein
MRCRPSYGAGSREHGDGDGGRPADGWEDEHMHIRIRCIGANNRRDPNQGSICKIPGAICK